MSRGLLSAGIFGIALVAPPAPLFADDFSLERLHAGEEALRARRIPEAVDQLRIACFGLLEQVEPLSECLVHLTLAQEASKRPIEVHATLIRFVEVERRFSPYAKAALPAETRRAFQTILRARLPEETILSIPSLASLVETEEQKIASMPPPERLKAIEAAARREPTAAKWTVALAQAHVALKQCRKAFEIMAKLPNEAWTSSPELFADLFVCQVELKDWADAEASAPRIPPAFVGRPDVEKATRDLAAERSRRKSK